MQVDLAAVLGRVLVTGGTGFVGSALVKRLVQERVRVRVLDNNVRGEMRRLAGLPGIECIEGDIVDPQTVRRACEGIDTLFHLAFINGTENFYKFPEKVLEVGVKGALNTLESAVQCGVRRYVVTSSSEVYQEPTHVPTTEEERIIIPDVRNPRFSYSGGKIITELLTLHYTAKTKLETVICRPHNFYGPDMGIGHVIPQMVMRMKKLSGNFSVKAIEFPIQGTGEETRSFCYIDDGVDGLLACAVKADSREIYHIGTEEEVRIDELAFRIAKELGVTITLTTEQQPAGGTTRRCPSIAKLRKLGFAPQWTLQEGLMKTVDWYRHAEDRAGNSSDGITK